MTRFPPPPSRVLVFLALLAFAPLAAQEADTAPENAQAVFKQRLAEIVKRQLGLTDAELQRLAQVNQKYEEQRRLLVQQERDLRIGLRDEIIRGDQADQKHVAWMLDELIKVQGTRLSILQSEQKDLSAFLTPVQRAKYLAIQNQVRKRLEAARQQQMEGTLTPQQRQRQRLQAWRQRQQMAPLPVPAPAPAPPPPTP
jgi:Spy/CpxP family protein refolding chaperone